MSRDATSPRERVLRLLRGERSHGIPCFSGMGNVTAVGLKECGLSFSEIHSDPEGMALSAASTHKLFGFECAVVPYDLGVEAELLGCELNFYPDSEELLYPTVKTKCVREAGDISIPKDLAQQGRVPVVTEALRLLKEDIGDLAAIGTHLLGPFTLGGQVVELDDWMKMPLKAPQKVEEILRVLSGLIIALAQVYKEAGADYLTLREMGACTDVLSPRTFKSLIQEPLTNIVRQTGLPTVLHICGNTNPIVEYMQECGAAAISVDQKNDLRSTRNKLGNDTILFGNFDPYNVLVNGTPEDVRRTVVDCIDSGVDAVWPGCDIWPTVPAENMKTLVEITREYGRRTKRGK